MKFALCIADVSIRMSHILNFQIKMYGFARSFKNSKMPAQLMIFLFLGANYKELLTQ